MSKREEVSKLVRSSINTESLNSLRLPGITKKKSVEIAKKFFKELIFSFHPDSNHSIDPLLGKDPLSIITGIIENLDAPNKVELKKNLDKQEMDKASESVKKSTDKIMDILFKYRASTNPRTSSPETLLFNYNDIQRISLCLSRLSFIKSSKQPFEINEFEYETAEKKQLSDLADQHQLPILKNLTADSQSVYTFDSNNIITIYSRDSKLKNGITITKTDRKPFGVIDIIGFIESFETDFKSKFLIKYSKDHIVPEESQILLLNNLMEDFDLTSLKGGEKDTNYKNLNIFSSEFLSKVLVSVDKDKNLYLEGAISDSYLDNIPFQETEKEGKYLIGVALYPDIRTPKFN